MFLTAARLAQSVERLTAELAERKVAGRTNTQGLEILRNEGTTFALQAVRPSRDSDDRVKWLSRFQLET